MYFVVMRGKLIPGSTRITQMLYTHGLCFGTLSKWSRSSFLNSNNTHVNNSYRRFQIKTSKQFDLLVPRSAKSIATCVDHKVFFELKNLLKNGLLTRKDVDEALANRACYTDLDNSLLVLECINKLPDVSPEKRAALLEEFLTEVKSVNDVVTEAHCLKVLECYLQNKYFENLDFFLSRIKDYDMNHSEKILLLCLKCMFLKGLEKSDFALPEELENSNVENNKELFATKFYNLVVSWDINNALEEISQKKRSNIKIGSQIYTTLLKALALEGKKLYIEHLTKEISLEEVEFSIDQISDILESIVLSKHYNLISDVQTICAYEVLLKASQILSVKLVQSNNVESAYDFINYVFNLKLCESDDTKLFFSAMYKSFIEGSYKVNHPLDDLINKCKQMRESGKCLYALEHALYCSLNKSDIKGSLVIFQAMFNDDLPLEPHYFWPLLITLKEEFGDEGIIYVLDRMNELKVPFNPETLTDYVFPNLSHLEFVEDILEGASLIDARHELLQEVFLLYTIKNGLFREGLSFLKKYPLREEKTYSCFDKYLMKAFLEDPCEDLVILAKEIDTLDPFLVISKLWSRNDVDAIRHLSNWFTKHKMYAKNALDAEAFIRLNEGQNLIKEVVSDLLCINRKTEQTDKQSAKIGKISRLEEHLLIEEAEINLAELKAKNMNADAQRLRLLKLYIQSQMYEKAIKTKKEVLEHMGKHPEFTPGYLIMLARLSAYEKDTENVVHYFTTLKEKYPNFGIGCITGLSLCISFVQSNLFKEMLALLRTLPKWDGTVRSLLPRPVQFLREVARLGLPDLADIVFKILLQKKYIDINVNTLQVYTKSYLNANDIDGAVEEYERIATSYGILCNTTPILWSVVEADRFDLVNRVTKLSASNSKSKAPFVTALTLIANKGDVNLLLSYSKKLHFTLDNYNMIKKFNEGSVPNCSNTAFKTLILAAESENLRYDHIIKGATRRIYINKNYERANDFLDFCKERNITLSECDAAKLNLYSRFSEIHVAPLCPVDNTKIF